MIRNLLILMVFLGFGFVANVAQSDIFVRQSPKAEDDNSKAAPKKRSFFLRPNVAPTTPTSRNRTSISRSRQGAPLLKNVGNLPQQLVQDMQYLAYWKAADRTPRTVQELATYAQALRSVNMERIVKERNQVMSKLGAIREQHVAEYRASVLSHGDNVEAFNLVNDHILASMGEASLLQDPGAAVTGVAKNYASQNIKEMEAAARKRASAAADAASRLNVIYRRPNTENSDADAPSSAAGRVYKNYR